MLPSEPMPFYAIAHHCNTEDGVNKAIKEGSNSIECDITPFWQQDQLQFSVFHDGDNVGYWLPRMFTFGQVGYDGPTSYTQFDNYLKNISHLIEKQNLALVIFDLKLHWLDNIPVKFNLVINAFVAKLKQHNIPEHLVVITVKHSKAKQVFAILDALKFDCFRDISFDPSNNYLNPIELFSKPAYLPPDQWLATLQQQHARLFPGFGIDAHVPHSPLSDWLALAKKFVAERDSEESLFKKVYYWTLAREDHTIAMLKTGVDGIIHDNVPMLIQLLKTQFATTHRLATQADTHAWHQALIASRSEFHLKPSQSDYQ